MIPASKFEVTPGADKQEIAMASNRAYETMDTRYQAGRGVGGECQQLPEQLYEAVDASWRCGTDD